MDTELMRDKLMGLTPAEVRHVFYWINPEPIADGIVDAIENNKKYNVRDQILERVAEKLGLDGGHF